MWKQLNSEEIFKHPRLTLLEDEVELPDGSQTRYLTFAHANDSVTIIAQKDGQILLCREYSYPINEILYQFPGGAANVGEEPSKAAQRELEEETGYVAGKITKLGWYYTNNRRSKAKMYVFLAQDIRQGKKEGGDPEEDIESAWVAREQIDTMIQTGEIVNLSILAAWSLFCLKANDVQ